MKIERQDKGFSIELTEVEALDLITELAKKMASMRAVGIPTQVVSIAAVETSSLKKVSSSTIRFVLNKSH